MPGIERDGYTIEPIIGLEIHVQLATRTKMFCSCAVEFSAPPNSRVCPVCLGLPGSLPVINREAVELAIRAGLALHCEIATATKWDRKSYFYPDLPKSYQISQYDQPICKSGHFELPFDGRIRKIRIRRAHLEEDAGKNIHMDAREGSSAAADARPGGAEGEPIGGATGAGPYGGACGADSRAITAIDLNRAGAPLLEIVTEPDLRCADEAREFAVQLQRLVAYLGISEANMMKGQMRFEPNVNLRIRGPAGEALTPIVEVKNLNSFRAVQRAIEFEIARQFDEWRATGRAAAPGNKSNRGWDDQREITLPQREKEEAADYRYLPDPDLGAVLPDAALVQHLREEMPELPIPRTERLICEYKLPPREAPALIADRASADLLDHAAEVGGDKVTLGKHFLSFWARLANQRKTTIAGLGVRPAAMAELATLAADGSISATAAARIAEAVVSDGADASPRRLAQSLGLMQSRDEGQVAGWVEQVLAANAPAVRDALENPKKLQAARGFLAGQVMKLSGGKADPKLAAALIESRLRQTGSD